MSSIAGSQPHETDTLIFDLRVRCDRIITASSSETDPRKMYYDSNVYSGMLEWQESGGQRQRFRNRLPRPIDPDILLVKLRPGQVSYPPYEDFKPKGVLTVSRRWLISIVSLRKG
jgi:DNA-directed RNA polymerase I and III subunit RPAC1